MTEMDARSGGDAGGEGRRSTYWCLCDSHDGEGNGEEEGTHDYGIRRDAEGYFLHV